MKKAEIIACLKATSLFQGLSPKDLALVSDVVIEKHIPSETVFIEEGAEAQEAYLILSGVTKVYRINPDGKEIHIAFRATGDIVGELALLDEGKRSAHVKSLRESMVLVIPKKEFVRLVKNNPSVAVGIIKTLAKRIRENTFVLHDVLSQQLTDRMLTLLQDLACYFPNQEITLSHEELANLLSATRPRVTEALHKLEKNSHIKLSHKRITVL